MFVPGARDWNVVGKRLDTDFPSKKRDLRPRFLSGTFLTEVTNNILITVSFRQRKVSLESNLQWRTTVTRGAIEVSHG